MSKTRKNIAIIGAGYTGLVAALRLAQSGHQVTIIEKSDSVGGLAADFVIEGQSIEKAYHHIFKTDTDIINLADELGVKDKINWQESSVSIYYNNRLYPFKGALDLIRFSPLKFVNRIRAGVVVLYLQKTNNWKAFSTISAHKWMLRYAGKQVTRVIWEPLLRGKFDKYFDKVSMAWLWARINIRSKSRDASGEKLGYFEGGFQTFTKALVDRLNEMGVVINTNTEIFSLKSINSDKVSIQTNDGSQTYQSVIATVPSHVFAKMIQANNKLKPSYINKLNSINYLGARILVFSSSQNISDYYWHNINDVNLPFLVFINHTHLVSKSYYSNQYIYYIATYLPHEHSLFQCSDEQLEKIWFDSLKMIFPDFSVKKVREKHHIKLKNAQHVVDIEYKNKLLPFETPLKNVYLSNFSQIYPEDRGTNFAVRDGNRVARKIQ
jgi:protoporphyrinogen oxidase